MAYREVTMVEVKEVLRQWLAGTAKKRIAARLGLDVKTVRRYIEAAQELGLAGSSTWSMTTPGSVSVRWSTSRSQASAW